MNPAVRVWLDTVANVRVHGETRQKPVDLFVQEQKQLLPLSALPYEAAVVRPVRTNGRSESLWIPIVTRCRPVMPAVPS